MHVGIFPLTCAHIAEVGKELKREEEADLSGR
jgi:hypothetical protein